MIRHHPADDLLTGYAAGVGHDAVLLIVATHLSFCAACRARVALASRRGGDMLDALTPVALAPEALAKTMAKLAMARLDRTESHQAAPVSRADATPPPLRAFLGCELSQVAWRRMGPRLSYVPQPAASFGGRRGARVRLLRGAPGAAVGSHGHRGLEYTLVLSGGFSDATGAYGPGDFQTAAPGLTHNPVADDDGDCVNLAVTTAPLTFDSLPRTLAARLFGF